MNKSNQREPNTVNGILRKIKKKANTGIYLYRGEPQHYEKEPYFGKVSSNFYREFLKDRDFDVEAEQFDIEEFQRTMLLAANKFSREPVSELERLAEIQHYGGKTNLIDFTTDFLIPLFMASQESCGRCGRIIFQKIELVKPYIEVPHEPVNRVIAQKSVFVRHPDGFIQPNKDDVINIPADLKKPIREHLERCHDISSETVYNDTHGFIRHQRLYPELYKAIYMGLIHKQQGDSENGKSN